MMMNQKEDEKKLPYHSLGLEASKCVFSQNNGFLSGLGAGIGFALLSKANRVRKFAALAGFSTIGMGLDLIYAKSVACRDILAEYESSKAKYLAELKPDGTSLSTHSSVPESIKKD